MDPPHRGPGLLWIYPEDPFQPATWTAVDVTVYDFFVGSGVADQKVHGVMIFRTSGERRCKGP